MKIFVILVMGAQLLSCSMDSSRQEDSEYWLPWRSGSSHSFQKVKIKTLKNSTQLQGDYANFFITPSFSHIDRELSGTTPFVDVFRDTEGVWIPRDFLSTELISLYAHIEKVAQMSQDLGIHVKGLWPVNVGVRVRATDGGREMMTNNAFYMGSLHALLFVPYTMGDLPISVNGGVIAHELFHGIFYKKIGKEMEHFEQVADILGREDLSHLSYNLVILRGINEGFADFFAWVYSQDTDFISHSLKRPGFYRSLNGTSQPFPSRKSLTKRFTKLIRSADQWGASPDEVLKSESYILGTYFAKFFRDLSLSLPGSNGAGRVLFHLIESLDDLHLNMTQDDRFTKEKLSMNIVLESFYKDWPEKSSYCHRVGKIKAQELSFLNESCSLKPSPKKR